MVRSLLSSSSRLLRGVSIRHRLITALCLLSLLPLLVSAYISFVESSQAIENKARVFATEIVKQVAKNVQLRLMNIEAQSATLVLSERVQSELARYAYDEPADKVEVRASMPTVLLDTYGSFDHINQMFFLDQEHHIMDSQVFATLGRAVEEFATEAPRLKGLPYWGTVNLWGGEKGIVMFRDIYFKANNQWAGSLFLGIRRAHFSEIIESVNLGSGSEIYILDARDGSTLVEGKTSLVGPAAGASGTHPALVEGIRHALQSGQKTGFLTYRSVEPVGEASKSDPLVETVFTQIPNTSWFVVNAIPHANLVAEARSLREKIVLIGSLGVVLAVVLSFIIWRSISDPLQELMGRIKDAKAGSYPAAAAQDGNDELATLSQAFTDMSLKLGHEHAQLEQRVRTRTQDLQEANLKLEQMSTTDALTGIANRRRFDEVLANEWRRAARFQQPVALAMIDLDWFKQYNDHYGHLAGDECLRQVAQIFASCIGRPGDLVARYGGEEFVFIAPATEVDSALQIANQLCEAMRAMALPHTLSKFGCVTASIGVAALTPKDGEGAELLVTAADRAMYRAKERGRNQALA